MRVVIDTNVLLSSLLSRRGASFIITHNIRHFRGTEGLGIRAVTPGEFLSILYAP